MVNLDKFYILFGFLLFCISCADNKEKAKSANVDVTVVENTPKIESRSSSEGIIDVDSIDGSTSIQTEKEIVKTPVPDPTINKSEAVSDIKISNDIKSNTLPSTITPKEVFKSDKEPIKKVKETIEKEILSEIAFRRNFFNYGTITQGEFVEHQYEFTNIGDTPLVIKDVVVSCGCTEPSYPFIPIAPGEKGFIGVRFDSKTKIGDQKSIVTVTANTEPAIWKLYLDGNVILPDSIKIDE